MHNTQNLDSTELLKSILLKNQKAAENNITTGVHDTSNVTIAPTTVPDSLDDSHTSPNTTFKNLIRTHINDNIAKNHALNSFVAGIFKSTSKTYNAIPMPPWPGRGFETEKFTVHIPTKCGSRSFAKYFSILNIKEPTIRLDLNTTPDLFNKPVIWVLRDPVSKFYSGLTTSFGFSSSPYLQEDENASVDEFIVRHTIGYSLLVDILKQYVHSGKNLKNLYHIPFDKVNLFTHFINQDNKPSLDLEAITEYLKTIIKPEDVYGKETWDTEVAAYEYLLANSKEYSLDDWRNFNINFY